MTHSEHFDHIIVGSGQATGTLLAGLIPTGDTIAVVEGAEVGGTCVNYGCTPTKTLVASAKVAHMVRRSSEFGVNTAPLTIDFAAVRARMNKIRHGGRDGLTGFIEGASNVTLIRGWATFESDKTLRVGDRVLEGGKIYINVGTRSLTPPISGLDDVEWMDNIGMLDIEALPDHLVIVGGGYIGVEFAQMFRRFGSEVTVIQRDDQLMPREDADVAHAIQEIIEGEGVRVLVGAAVESVRQDATGVHVSLTKDGTETTITGSHLLLATGRRPNSDGLNLQNTSINVDRRGYIEVDEFCATTAEDIFAVGDVNGQGAFTHTSVNDAEIVLDYLFGSRDGVGIRKLSDRVPTYALFSDPPLGRVGMTEKEALKKGHKILKAVRPMSRIARAKEMGETLGFAKMIVDAETDLILGVSILGVGGDEIINMFAAIMFSKIPCKNYRRVVLVHPTVSELMPWILDGLEPV